MANAALLVLYALATTRVTGLITADKITSKWRAALVRRLLPESPSVRVSSWGWFVGTLITCSWCVSIYVGTIAAIVWYTVGDWPPLVVAVAALSFSQIAGMLSDVGRA